ncbi:hypothetical protein PMAYCL1PPCAC_00198, partial [Pristionchus mayeri]
RAEFNRVNPDSVELIALLALAVWDAQMIGANEKLADIAIKNRTDILKEMRKVYGIRDNIHYTNRQEELIGLLNRLKSNNCDSVKIRPNSAESDGILRRIDRAYNASVSRRRSQEWKVLESINDRKIVQHPTETLYMADENTPVQTFNICYAETRIFIREAFPSLTKLSQ